MTVSSKRPEQVAWVAMVLSLVFFGIAFLLGRWSGFYALSAVGWQSLAAALIWLVLAIQFHQRSLAEQEKLDMSQLAREKSSATIFQKGETAALLAAAQRRLDVLEKWFIPVFAALIAVYEIGIGLYLLKGIPSGADVKTQQPLVCAIVATAIAFMGFLLSRYATGMSAEPRWKPLRAGGSFFLGLAVLCFVLAIALALLHFQISPLIAIVSYAVPILLIILGAETALNLVFDIYRPHLKGQYSRAAFDSRLLGVINEPGGIFRSVATAMDYQFGFQVSQTWFYKLLEKAIIPLVLFSAATLYLASCIVIVGPNEEGIVERFGRPTTADGEVRHIGPGLHFKLPWPMDIAYLHPTGLVMELHIGYVPKVDANGIALPETRLLWGQTHYEQEHDLMVAARYTPADVTEGPPEGAVPVSLVKVNMPVQYRIKDLLAYVYGHSNPGKLLEGICYRELVRLASTANVEVEGGGDQNLLAVGRTNAKQTLTERIQRAADAEGLGVEITFVGLQGIHPPAEVVPDFQAVVGAVQAKQALVLAAEAERNRNLTTLAGSVSRASRLADLASQYQEAQRKGLSDEVKRLGEQFDAALLNESRGDIFRILSEAQSYRFRQATLAEATGKRFAGQIQAYRAAPEIYKCEQRAVALEEAMRNIRKYVVAGDPNDRQVIIIELQEKLDTSLLSEIAGVQETGGQ
ncbi:MAG TPA: SPFH domain-containing protein [Sedimentisphaerales bacterium]|nr:SPFH domain-containing protein [Sedimentisphaerales bacterium]